MEAQVKEENKETSLHFESTDSQDLNSLSLIERYDRFIQNYNENDYDDDDDDDFFPDCSVLREHYDNLLNKTADYVRTSNNHRLSAGSLSKYKTDDATEVSVVVDDDENETDRLNGHAIDKKFIPSDEKSGLICLNQLIEKLESAKKCEDGNTTYINDAELEAIQESYRDILDFINDRKSVFEKTKISKELDAQRDSDDDNDGEAEEQKQDTCVDEQACKANNEEASLLNERMEALQRARDKYYEIEGAVREQLEQLELVERYKMESVG